MISCFLMGGLGNQLFQIFTCISFSISNNIPFHFNISEKSLGMIKRPSYWFTLLRSLRNYFIVAIDNKYNYKLIQEMHFHYTPLPHIAEDFDYKLYGYFQSYKYFDLHKQTIFNMIPFETLKKEVRTKIDFSSDAVSLHFRIGDYKQLQMHHPILQIEYYINALTYLHSKIPDFHIIPIIYFYEIKDSEDVTKKISILKKIFRNPFIAISHDLADWEQLLLMSQCKYNIMANSTFSWWASYLNMIENKIVLYPNIWFGDALKHDTKDLFLEDWIKIE